jgi:hypothetical protein
MAGDSLITEEALPSLALPAGGQRKRAREYAYSLHDSGTGKGAGEGVPRGQPRATERAGIARKAKAMTAREQGVAARAVGMGGRSVGSICRLQQLRKRLPSVGRSRMERGSMDGGKRVARPCAVREQEVERTTVRSYKAVSGTQLRHVRPCSLQSSPSAAMRALRATELPWVAACKDTAKRKAMLGVSVNPPVCRKEEVWIAKGKMGWRPAQREPALSTCTLPKNTR